MFAGYLRQGTAADIEIGPVWHTTTGALKDDLAYNATGINCDLHKNGVKSDLALANSAGAGYWRASTSHKYLLTLATGNVDTLGRLKVSLDATDYVTTDQVFTVLSAAVYDVLFGTAALSTYAGGDTAGVTSLVARLTAARAGYLDNLDAAITSRLADADYIAPDSAADIKTAMEAAGGSLAQLVAGVITNATGADVATDVVAMRVVADAIKTITDTLTGPAVTIASPVAASGDITIYQGDDYATEEARQITFAVADAAHNLALDGGTVSLKLKEATFEASAVVESVAGWTVTFELTNAETAALTKAVQAYELEAVLANAHVVTLQRGTARLVADIPTVEGAVS